MNKEDIVVKAYVTHAGTTKFDNRKFAAFLGKFPEVLTEMPRADVKHAIQRRAGAFEDDVNPILSIGNIKSFIGNPTAEVSIFFKSAPARKQAFLEHLKNFPFSSPQSRSFIRKAILLAYGAEPVNPEADIGAGLDKGLEDLGTELGAPPAPAPAPDAGVPGEPPVVPPEVPEDVPGTESLPPEIEEQAVATLNGYLQKDVFNNKIIPVVTIKEAWKLQNGYVVTFEMASLDKSVSAFTTAVVYNDKLVLPAEIRDSNDAVIGEFNKDTILGVFAEQEGAMPRESDNYTDLMGQMMSSKTEEKAAKVLDLILHKFGHEVARGALDSYTRIKHSKRNNPKIGAADRLVVSTKVDVRDVDIIDDEEFEKKYPSGYVPNKAQPKKKEDK